MLKGIDVKEKKLSDQWDLHGAIVADHLIHRSDLRENLSYKKKGGVNKRRSSFRATISWEISQRDSKKERIKS